MDTVAINPPANYGRIKRRMFNLGVKAYARPNRESRAIYNLGAAAIGQVGRVFNPFYDYGGIRREIEIALKEENGDFHKNGLLREFNEDELKRMFHPAFCQGIADPGVLALAMSIMDHHIYYSRKYETVPLFLSWAAVSIVGFGSISWQHCQNNGPVGGAVIGFSLAISLGGYFLNRAFEWIRITNTLSGYLSRMDRNTLVNNISSFPVHSITRFVLKENIRDNFPEDKALYEAVAGMPAIESR